MRRKSAAHHTVKVAVPGGRCLVNDAAVNGEACTLVAADGKFVLSKYRFLKDVIKNRQILSDLAVILSRQPNVWSEWRESNSRPLEPHTSELPNSTLHPVKIGYFYFNCYNQLKTIIRGYCSPPCGISWYDSDSIDMASILLPRNAISILIIIRDKSMAHTHLLMMTS